MVLTPRFCPRFRGANLAVVNPKTIEAVGACAINTLEMRSSALAALLARVKSGRSTDAEFLAARVSACELRLQALAPIVAKLLWTQVCKRA